MRTRGKGALLDLINAYDACDRCPLLQESRTRVVFGSGASDAKILVVGEAPGADEDYIGDPFVGPAGQMLMNLFAKAFADASPMKAAERASDDVEYYREVREYLDTFVFWTNLVSCRPPENRDPIKDEIKACSDRLMRTIYAVDPLLIIGAGKLAASRLLGKNVAVTNVSGTIYDITIDSPVTGRPVRYPMMALVHPAWLLRQGDQDLVRRKRGHTYNAIQDVSYAAELLSTYMDRALGADFPPE